MLRRLATSLLLALGVPMAADAQVAAPDADATSAEAAVERLSLDLDRGTRAHLRRVGVWGGTSFAGGLALALATDRDDRPGRWAFGAQTAGWGAVNVGIAALGLLGSDLDAADGYGAALSDERRFHDILVLNMGLNVAYMAVGTTMVVASYRGIDDAEAWRGHGGAVIGQGLGLFVLDGIALLASRSRLGRLLDLPGTVSASVAPRGGRLTWRF
jgi:hypothetical protein